MSYVIMKIKCTLFLVAVFTTAPRTCIMTPMAHILAQLGTRLPSVQMHISYMFSETSVLAQPLQYYKVKGEEWPHFLNSGLPILSGTGPPLGLENLQKASDALSPNCVWVNPSSYASMPHQMLLQWPVGSTCDPTAYIWWLFQPRNRNEGCVKMWQGLELISPSRALSGFIFPVIHTVSYPHPTSFLVPRAAACLWTTFP